MAAICCARMACAQEAPAEAETPDGRPRQESCFFASSEATIVIEAADRREPRLPIYWSLWANGRQLSGGASDAVLRADDATPNDLAEYVFAIPTPPIRPGVVFPVELQVAWTSNGHKHRERRELFLYPQDAFATRRDVLDRVHISLFDPEGATALVLDGQQIAYTRLANLAAMGSVVQGVLVVGEGVDFGKHPGLGAAMIQTARRGVSVLCLAPSAGDFSLAAGDEVAASRPAELVMGSDAYVRKYDKRFDLSRACTLSLDGGGGDVAIGCNLGDDAWHGLGMSWLVLVFTDHQDVARSAKLVVCGADVVARWQASPVPRYLLIHLLQELTDAAEPTSVANSATPPLTEN